jgi:hypothetical protein
MRRLFRHSNLVPAERYFIWQVYSSWAGKLRQQTVGRVFIIRNCNPATWFLCPVIVSTKVAASGNSPRRCILGGIVVGVMKLRLQSKTAKAFPENCQLWYRFHEWK